MKKTTLIVAAMLAGTSLSAYAKPASETTTDFVKNASISDMFEIQSSKLAMKKSSDPQVKAFAAKMITDHSKSSAGLKSALAKSHLNVKPAMALDADHQEMLADLQNDSGADFDSTYLNDQTKTHDEAVALFDTYSNEGDSPALKAFATKTLPVIKMHQKHVHAMTDKQ